MKRQGRRAWWALAAGGMGLIGVLPSPVAADAGSASAEGFDAAAFEAAQLAADQGISQAQARQRLQWQEASTDVSNDARAALGAEYGGVWVDPTDGRLQLGVVGGGARATAAAQQVVTAAGAATGTDVVPVDHGMGELNDATAWLGDQVAGLTGPTSSSVSSGLRPDLNAVVLHVPADGSSDAAVQALVAEAQQRYGDMVRVQQDGRPIQGLACSYPYCDPPLRAGVGIDHSSGQVFCTGAFLTRSRSDNRLYQLTAGHCAQSAQGGTWATKFAGGSVHTIGPVQRYSFGLAADAAILRVNNPAGWRARAWVYVTPSATTNLNEAYRIHGTGRSVIGARLCISGAFYGSSNCGTITEVGITGDVCDDEGNCTTVSGLGRASTCAIPGDSGSAMYAANLAVGILSGGYSECDTVYSGISAVQNALNVNVSTEPG